MDKFDEYLELDDLGKGSNGNSVKSVKHLAQNKVCNITEL